jgi:hypothetical protein
MRAMPWLLIRVLVLGWLVFMALQYVVSGSREEKLLTVSERL